MLIIILTCLVHMIVAAPTVLLNQAAHDSHNTYCTHASISRSSWSFTVPTLSFHPLNPYIVIDPLEDLLYIPAATKDDYQTFLLVVSAKTGQIIKNVTMDQPKRRVSGNPILIKNQNQTLYTIGGYPDAKSETPGVFTVDINTGKRTWSVVDNSTESDMNIYNLALSHDNILLFQRDGVSSKDFLAVRIDQPGSILWHKYCERDSYITVDDDGYFYVIYEDLLLKKIDVNGKEIFVASLPADDWISFHDRKISINKKSGNIHIPATDATMSVQVVTFSGKDGSILWSGLLDRAPYKGWTFSSDPAVTSDGNILYMLSTDENGKGPIAYSFNASTGDLNWKLVLPTDSSWCSKILIPCSGDNFMVAVCRNVMHVISDAKILKSFKMEYEWYYGSSIDSSNSIYTCGNIEKAITGTLQCSKIMI